MRYFVYTVITLVVASIIAGFFLIGSPQEERLRRFDERRVNDLEQLQSGIVNYFLAKNMLPENLTALSTQVAIPADPETNLEYEYAIQNKDTFSLCAIFALPSLPNQGSQIMYAPKAIPALPSNTNWDHGMGHTCFQRQIDKDFYKSQRPA